MDKLISYEKSLVDYFLGLETRKNTDVNSTMLNDSLS